MLVGGAYSVDINIKESLEIDFTLLLASISRDSFGFQQT